MTSGPAERVAHYVSRFARFAEQRGTQEPGWLRRLREQAIGSFEESGFPTTRLEEWRYTNLAPIVAHPFELISPMGETPPRHQIEELAAPLFACSLLVFVNGHYRSELSTPVSLLGDTPVKNLAQVLTEDPARLETHLAQQADFKGRPFVALNTAFLEDGALVEIPEGVRLDQPLHLLFLSTDAPAPGIVHPRVLVTAGEGSRATIIQQHLSIGAQPRLINSVMEITTRARADLEFVLVQRENDTSHHISSLHLHQAHDSRLACHTITLGGALVRNDLTAILAEEGAELDLRGLFFGEGGGVIDNHTLVDHALPHCTSRQLYKGILSDHSRGVFRGRVIVRPDAQQSDARQSNPNLLLSDGAEVDTKPQLEIYADDVKCSHGATIGQIDADALFYLRSRGIDEHAALELLTEGFAAEICQTLPAPALGERVRELLRDRLGDVSAGAAGMDS
ncbi:MAG: Fe-S cluster assembly protein SufD [Myxococcota bacterium]